MVPIQIILVPTITKFYYFSPSCCRQMQGDEKLHHLRKGMFRDSPRNRVKPVIWGDGGGRASEVSNYEQGPTSRATKKGRHLLRLTTEK